MVSVLHEGKVSAVTSADGNCEFKNIPAGDYRLEVINIGQTKTCRIKVTDMPLQYFRIAMQFDLIEIEAVTITAKAGDGITSSSVIGQDAIQHIQPSSFADLLELLPGGMAQDPSFKAAQTIRLREADPISSYSTSSLGTQFLIDGIR